MSLSAKYTILILRLSMGWFLFYAGIVKVLDPTWSAAGFLNNATTFGAFYQWFASPQVLPLVNILNAWGLTLLGLSLLAGFGLRISAPLAAFLMMVYYFPTLQFPHPTAYTFVVDDHLIYAITLLLLAMMRAGHIWGVAQWLRSLPKFDKYRRWLRYLD